MTWHWGLQIRGVGGNSMYDMEFVNTARLENICASRVHQQACGYFATCRWGAWAGGMGFAVAVFAAEVFFQYNSEDIAAHLVIERWQLTGVLWLVVTLRGVHRGILGRGSKWFPVHAAFLCGVALTVYVWLGPEVVRPVLVVRWLSIDRLPYREPQLGIGEHFVYLASMALALVTILSLLRKLPGRDTSRRLVGLGTVMWLHAVVRPLGYRAAVGSPLPSGVRFLGLFGVHLLSCAV